MTTKFNSPYATYVPTFLRNAFYDSRPLQLTFEDLFQSNIQSKDSFKYQPLETPIKNTQQLNVDWTKFENHTFFMSAEAKTNLAFDTVINGFPFDGTKSEVERFFEKITGFEKWIFDSFPEFSGQLHFSGTQVGEDPSGGFPAELGNFIIVKDIAGWLLPETSKTATGESCIFPGDDDSFTIEAQIFLPDQNNDTQVILQKQSIDMSQGITFYLQPSTDSYVTGTFIINSGSVNNSVSALLTKGKFNHVCVTLSKELQQNSLQFFIDGSIKNQNVYNKKTYTSLFNKDIKKMTDRSDLYIGSGSSFILNNAIVTPTQTFSGTIDELRVYHSTRTITQQQHYATKGLFANSDLKLYFRFNEPPVPLTPVSGDYINSIVLDSSGNSLHGIIKNFDVSRRQNADEDDLNPVKNERKEFKKVLFPLHPSIIALNNTLLTSASFYDENNPNLITKLIPRHYLREGALKQGYDNNIDGFIGNSYSPDGGVPGQGKLGSSQIILTFLYIWAKFFDEIKMFVDAFRTLRTVEYDVAETIPDNFLMDFVRAYGFYLPPFFNATNVSQYVEGEDIQGISISDYSLKQVQTQILRRILKNMPDVIRSKGTQHSIKSFLRSVGIDPDNSLRIREFGGPSIKYLGIEREKKKDIVSLVDCLTSSLLTSQYLSGSRIEPGYPDAVGPFVNEISSFPADGLFTSGSWTFEGMYYFGPQNKKRFSSLGAVQGKDFEPQSLVRFETTGSNASAQQGLVMNLVTSGSLTAYIRPGMGSSSPLLTLSLPNVDITDGNTWMVSVGCRRNDELLDINDSYYFLRAATPDAGDISANFVTASFFTEQTATEGNVFRTINSSLNASGTFIRIGNENNLPAGAIGYYFLNDTLTSPAEARTSKFVGQVGNIKLWSKFINDVEWEEHVKNYKSVGVDDPYVNYNYVSVLSGSFEKIRMLSLQRQENMNADVNGDMQFLDFSENDMSIAGQGFEPEKRVYFSNIMGYSYLSPYFDEYSTSEKVRIRSFKEEENLKAAPWATLAPMYELPIHETPLDDPRLSIEFSLSDALNRDIITMFSTLDPLADALGRPELMYSPDYPDLERLRDIYFNRIKEKLNFRGFFEFYKWFDQSISSFVEQLVPRKTRFKGTNFVVESHMLERNKMEYYSNEIYLGDVRSRPRDVLLLQQVAGIIVRF